MRKLSVSIPNPCTQNWDEMTKTEQGKLCAACHKIVIDFSNMTNDEIIKILLEKKGKKICGNFYNTQIEQPMVYLQKRNFPKWPAVAAMLVAGLFQLSAPNVYSQSQNQKLYSKEVNLKGSSERKEEVKTEPGTDTLITYTIKVFSATTKAKLSGINVYIDSVGTFSTDKNGEVKIDVAVNKVPNMVSIQAYSNGYEYQLQNLTIAKSRLAKVRYLEIYMKDMEKFMLKGDVDINYHGN